MGALAGKKVFASSGSGFNRPPDIPMASMPHRYLDLLDKSTLFFRIHTVVQLHIYHARTR